MEKNAYYIQVGNLSKEDIYAGTNKREAIKKGKEVAMVEQYHHVLAYVTAMVAEYKGKEYNVCRVTIF